MVRRDAEDAGPVIMSPVRLCSPYDGTGRPRRPAVGVPRLPLRYEEFAAARESGGLGDRAGAGGGEGRLGGVGDVDGGQLAGGVGDEGDTQALGGLDETGFAGLGVEGDEFGEGRGGEADVAERALDQREDLSDGNPLRGPDTDHEGSHVSPPSPARHFSTNRRATPGSAAQCVCR